MQGIKSLSLVSHPRSLIKENKLDGTVGERTYTEGAGNAPASEELDPSYYRRLQLKVSRLVPYPAVGIVSSVTAEMRTVNVGTRAPTIAKDPK